MSQPVTIDYRPHPSTVRFHESLAQVKALCGPVGSGKTTAVCWDWYFLCQEARVPLRGCVMRESYRQLHDSTRPTFVEWFRPICHYVKQDEVMELTLPNVDGEVLTHELHFRHARRVEEASNFLSTEYALIWLEEVVPALQVGQGVVGGGIPKGIFDIALMRQRQKGAHRLHIDLSFNPPSKFHWTYKEFFQRTPEELAKLGYALFRQPAGENKKHLPPLYYEKLLDRLDENLARRFVMGETVTLYPGVRVYPHCYEQTHFADALVPARDVPLIAMFDFGLTPVALIAQVLPSARLVVYREVQMWSAGIERLAEHLGEVLKDEFPGMKVARSWGDPAGAQRAQTDERTCFEILGAKGIPVLPGAVDFTSRQEAVDQRLSRWIDNKPAILIDRQRCPVLMEGLLGGYRYPQSHDGQVGSRPLKNDFSHACNALEYGCTGEFSITTGESKRAPQRRPQSDPLSRRRPQHARSWMTH